MENRNRNILVVLIGIVIAVAILSSFGLRLFYRDTDRIQLPTGEASPTPDSVPGMDSGLVRVEITPETVQSVIAMLARPSSYYREVTVEDFWGEGESGVTQAKVWVDGGWTMTEATWPGGTVRHSIVGDGRFWLWYGGEEQVLEGPADAFSADLEGQRIPTYEDVLELETDSILSADYRTLEGLSCIYVESAADAYGWVRRYWVDADSGLLVCAELAQDGVLTYRMSSYTVERPVPADTAFVLPDGSVLHTVGGQEA